MNSLKAIMSFYTKIALPILGSPKATAQTLMAYPHYSGNLRFRVSPNFYNYFSTTDGSRKPSDWC